MLGLEIEAAEVSVTPPPARGAQENLLVWIYFADQHGSSGLCTQAPCGAGLCGCCGVYHTMKFRL